MDTIPVAGKSTSLNTLLIDQMAKVLSFLTVLHKRAIATPRTAFLSSKREKNIRRPCLNNKS